MRDADGAPSTYCVTYLNEKRIYSGDVPTTTLRYLNESSYTRKAND